MADPRDQDDPYDALAGRLRETAGRRVVALPDGSVDTYYRVFDGRGGPVESRSTFGERIADGTAESFQVRKRDRRPGGQAYNVASQAASLGDEVTLAGHLDDPVFSELPFEAASMGEPADVHVYVFDDGEVMFSEESADLRSWSLSALPATGERALAAADAVVAVNWVSVPGIDGALRGLPTHVGPGTPVVFDPGDLTGADADAIAGLAGSLSALDDHCRVVVSADGGETERLAAAFDVDAGSVADRLRGIRTATGVTAAVLHETERAAVATADGVTSVGNLAAPAVARRTGAGDHFDGGLAHGLAAGWDWEPALALGNACASYYVAHDDTADPRALARFLERTPLPD